MREERLKGFMTVLLLAWLILMLTSPLFLGVEASSTTVTLNPSDDAHVYAYDSGSNYGSSEYVYVSGDSTFTYYGYIKFDLSSIPSGSAIVSAKLRLYGFYFYDAGTGNLEVYRVTGSWSESSITWDNKPGDAGSPTDTVAVPGSGNTWVEWDVTDDVQAFIDGTYDNYGWVIKRTSGGRADFYAKEKGDHLPELVIEYIPPNTVTVTETQTVTQTVTETETVTETITETQTTTVANTTITETQTSTITQTITETQTQTETVNQTITTTQTINNTVTETVTTTVANTTVTSTYYSTIYETVSPTYGNQTVNYYTDLANQLMPLVMVIGVICTMLSLLLSATKGR